MTERDDQLARARWEGQMEARLYEVEGSTQRRLDHLREDIAAVEKIVGEIRTELATVKTKVAFYGMIGGLVGSAVVGIVVVIGSRGIG